MDGVLQIVLKTGFFGKIDHFPPLFQQFLPMDPKILNRPIKWPHLYHFKVYESSNKPIVGVLMEPIRQNGHIIIQLCQLSIQIHNYLIDSLRITDNYGKMIILTFY